MTRFRFSFLPVFFLCLGTAFAAAVAVRVHNYSAETAAEEGLAATSSAEARAAADAARRRQQLLLDDPVPIDGLTPAETGTIIPVGETASPASIAAARAAREQRYQELLNAGMSSSSRQGEGQGGDTEPNYPAASAPQPAPAPKQESTITRLLRPLVNAVSGRQSSPVQQPPGPEPHTPPENRPRERDPVKDKDPSSDTMPPQVMAIDFVPATVHDGEETVLGVVAVDDLSGVRTISGSIVSPSGGLQGFALQREGDTTRYSSRIVIPKDSPEGIWRVNYLNLTDNAGNPLSLTYNGGGAAILANAAFRVVSNRPDSAGPTLKAVWIDKPSIRAGERDTIFIQADDDKSGVHMVSGVFQSPQKFARIGFGCRGGDNGVWQCDLSTPVCLDCGDWQLEQIQMQDKANNMTTVQIDNPKVAAVRVNIVGESCDGAPPVLQSAVLDTNAVSNAEVSTITMTVTASDDVCGVASISGQAAGPQTEGGQPPRIYFSFAPAGDSNTWVGKITVPKLAAKGLWNVAWMQLLDKGNNLKTYSHADGVLANAVFRVQ